MKLNEDIQKNSLCLIIKSDLFKKYIVSGEVILEAVPHGMVACVVFAHNLRIFRTPYWVIH